jgi:hypothetical protein
MRAISVITILLLVVSTGCSRMTSSGIPQALNSDTLLKTVGAAQGIALSPGSHGEASDARSVETERRFHATISSGTGGQLLASYQSEVERTIRSMGGTIHGTGISRSADDVRDFSFSYTWGGNAGIVRVYSFNGTNSSVQVVLFCYEHRR